MAKLIDDPGMISQKNHVGIKLRVFAFPVCKTFYVEHRWAMSRSRSRSRYQATGNPGHSKKQKTRLDITVVPYSYVAT